MNPDVAARLVVDAPMVRDLLVRFLRNETERIGLHTAVIGLSGGIDSAVSAFLAAEAFGPENVVCVMLPYRTSNPDSLRDAHAVVKQLGVRSETVEITPMVDPYFERTPDMSAVRRGNVMARERMIVLYDVSAREQGLVIGTGNKTEILLGYTTLFGDSACAINPVGDLYKTQLRQLAAFLGVPSSIQTKAPSADLWEGQTDEGEIGVTYAEADEILLLMVDERRTDDEIVALGYDEAIVKKLGAMIARNQYKRMPPVIGKVGPRTVNADFRYARDWKS